LKVSAVIPVNLHSRQPGAQRLREGEDWNQV